MLPTIPLTARQRGAREPPLDHNALGPHDAWCRELNLTLADLRGVFTRLLRIEAEKPVAARPGAGTSRIPPPAGSDGLSLHKHIMAEYAFAMERFASSAGAHPQFDPSVDTKHRVKGRTGVKSNANAGQVAGKPGDGGPQVGGASWFSNIESAQQLDATLARRGAAVGAQATHNGDARQIAVLGDMAQDVAELRQRVAHAELQRDQLRHEVDSLVALLKEKHITVAELERHVAKSESNEYALRQEVSALQSTISQLRRELVASNDVLNRESILAARLDKQSERRLADAKVEISTLYHQIRTSTLRLDHMEQELTQCQQEKEEYALRQQELTKQLDETNASLHSESDHLTTLRRDYDYAKVEHRDLEWAFQDLLLASGHMTLGAFFAHQARAGNDPILRTHASTSVPFANTASAAYFQHRHAGGQGGGGASLSLWALFSFVRSRARAVEVMPAFSTTSQRVGARLKVTLAERYRMDLPDGGACMPLAPMALLHVGPFLGACLAEGATTVAAPTRRGKTSSVKGSPTSAALMAPGASKTRVAASQQTAWPMPVAWDIGNNDDGPTDFHGGGGAGPDPSSLQSLLVAALSTLPGAISLGREVANADFVPVSLSAALLEEGKRSGRGVTSAGMLKKSPKCVLTTGGRGMARALCIDFLEFRAAQLKSALTSAVESRAIHDWRLDNDHLAAVGGGLPPTAVAECLGLEPLLPALGRWATKTLAALSSTKTSAGGGGGAQPSSPSDEGLAPNDHTGSSPTAATQHPFASLSTSAFELLVAMHALCADYVRGEADPFMTLFLLVVENLIPEQLAVDCLDGLANLRADMVVASVEEQPQLSDPFHIERHVLSLARFIAILSSTGMTVTRTRRPQVVVSSPGASLVTPTPRAGAAAARRVVSPGATAAAASHGSSAYIAIAAQGEALLTELTAVAPADDVPGAFRVSFTPLDMKRLLAALALDQPCAAGTVCLDSLFAVRRPSLPPPAVSTTASSTSSKQPVGGFSQSSAAFQPSTFASEYVSIWVDRYVRDKERLLRSIFAPNRGGGAGANLTTSPTTSFAMSDLSVSQRRQESTLITVNENGAGVNVPIALLRSALREHNGTLTGEELDQIVALLAFDGAVVVPTAAPTAVPAPGVGSRVDASHASSPPGRVVLRAVKWCGLTVAVDPPSTEPSSPHHVGSSARATTPAFSATVGSPVAMLRQPTNAELLACLPVAHRLALHALRPHHHRESTMSASAMSGPSDHDSGHGPFDVTVPSSILLRNARCLYAAAFQSGSGQEMLPAHSHLFEVDAAATIQAQLLAAGGAPGGRGSGGGLLSPVVSSTALGKRTATNTTSPRLVRRASTDVFAGSASLQAGGFSAAGGGAPNGTPQQASMAVHPPSSAAAAASQQRRRVSKVMAQFLPPEDRAGLAVALGRFAQAEDVDPVETEAFEKRLFGLHTWWRAASKPEPEDFGLIGDGGFGDLHLDGSTPGVSALAADLTLSTSGTVSRRTNRGGADANTSRPVDDYASRLQAFTAKEAAVFADNTV